MTFYNEIQKYSWQDITTSIYAKTASDVELALAKDKLDLEDFMALVSPAAEGYLEQMAAKSMALTQKRFGKTIQFYIPLYLSNSCANVCVYCGFNHKNKFERKILSKAELLSEAKRIKALGFDHILLVTGEDNHKCGADYIGEMMEEIKDVFSLISIEVQPLKSEEYASLTSKGLNTVYIYQETYNQQNYKKYHTGGKKSDYQHRIETPDRLGKAGVHKIGLGCLLGLEDWRVDSFFTALHLNYLEKKYWQTKYSISFPRLRPHAGQFQPNYETSQKNLAQLIFAYRLLNEHVEISLSTRESPAFRDNMIKLGATAYSAGSKTNPGGYSNEAESLEQFAVHDDREPKVIEAVINEKGYEVVWKDWDSFMQ